MGNFLSVVFWNQAFTLTFSDIFSDECDMTLNDPRVKVKVIHFDTNRFLTYIRLPIKVRPDVSPPE